MNVEQNEMWDCLVEYTPEKILQAFINYHGSQILDSGFYEFLVDEGYFLGKEDK